MSDIIIPKKSFSSFTIGAFVTLVLLSLISGTYAATVHYLGGNDIDMGGGRVTNLGSPSVGTDVATKNYVDTASGGATYQGLTTASYDGGQKGLFEANKLCDAEYSGSHICTASEIINSGITTMNETAWIVDDSMFASGKVNCWGYMSTGERISLVGGPNLNAIDVKVRSDSRPLVAVCDDSNDNVTVHSCDDPACSSFTTYHIASITAPDYCRVALRSDDTAVIVYNANTNIYLYDCDDNNCSSGTLRTLSSDTDYEPAVAINESDIPYVAYYKFSGGTCSNGKCLYVHTCADSDCSSGTNRKIFDSTIKYGTYPQIEFQENKMPVIAYVNGHTSVYDIEFYECTAIKCQTKSAKGSINLNSGDYLLDSDKLGDRMAIIHIDGTDLKIAYCEDDDCDNLLPGKIISSSVSGSVNDVRMDIGLRDRIMVAYGPYNSNYVIYELDSSLEVVDKTYIGDIETPAIAIDEISGRWVLVYEGDSPTIIDEPSVGTTIGRAGFGRGECIDTNKFACCG